MSPQLQITLMTLAFGLLQTIVFYLIKKRDAKNEKLEKEIQELKLEIQKLKSDMIILRSKLWSEEKLEEAVKKSVRLVFLEFENKQLKKEKEK